MRDRLKSSGFVPQSCGYYSSQFGMFWLYRCVCVFVHVRVCVFEGSPAGTEVLGKRSVTCWRQVRKVCKTPVSHGWRSAQGTASPLQLGQQESRRPDTSASIHSAVSSCSSTKWIIMSFCRVKSLKTFCEMMCFYFMASLTCNLGNPVSFKLLCNSWSW